MWMAEAVEKLCPMLGYLIDIHNGWNLNLKLQTLEDWRLMKKIKSFFASKAPANEVTSNSFILLPESCIQGISISVCWQV